MSKLPPPLPASHSMKASPPPLPVTAATFMSDDDMVPPPPPPKNNSFQSSSLLSAGSHSDDFAPPPPPPPEEYASSSVDFLTGHSPSVFFHTNTAASPTTAQPPSTSPPAVASRPSASSLSQMIPSRSGSISSSTIPASSPASALSVPGPPPPRTSVTQPSPASSRSNSTASVPPPPPPPGSRSKSNADQLAFPSPSAYPNPPSGASSPVLSPTSTTSIATRLSLGTESDEDTFPTPSSSSSSQNASQLTAAQDLGSAKSFASSLTHDFAGVQAQVEIGSYAEKRVASFLKKMALAQEEYSKTITKLLLHEQTKMAKLSQDHMVLSSKCWISIQEIFANIAKSHLSESSEIALQVVAPLQEFYGLQEAKRREILSEERKSSLEMIKAREDVSKSLTTCTRLVEEAKKLQSEAKDEAAKTASGEKSSFFKSLSMKVGKKPEAVIKEASKAAAVYQTNILTANKRQQRYLEQDLPKLFNDMQQMEKKRLEIVKQRLTKYYTTTSTYAAERAALMTQFKEAVDTNNSSADITEFIEESLYQHGPPIAPRPFQYELSCSPSDIEAGRLEGNPNSIFRSSLDHVMELQRHSQDPQAARMDIPRILTTLIQRIQELGGYSELGIFRISVGKEDLDALRKQIDTDGNYNLSNIKNAHVCAALLKEWLRLLTDPLIPTDSFYQQAIDSVKGMSGQQFNPVTIQKLYDNLPPLNQKILRELSLMVKEISNPVAAEKSKMNVENLAIVFAPSFLRNPSEDPLKLLENTKYETKFTASLFKTIADIKW